MKKYPYTLLYAEDDYGIRSAYKRLFNKFFKKVITVANGAEAFNVYEELHPDIIIADILMPQMDGLQFIKRIRNDDFITRVILLTAYSDRERLLKATELNITRYLIKPVKKNDLLQTVEIAVQQLEKLKGKVVAISDNCTFNLHSHILECCGEEIKLTKSESLFLTIIASNPEKIFSSEEISSIFFTRYDKDLSTEAIKAIIKRLRKKIPFNFIENRFGYGYRLMSQPIH
ncbi:response regulator transcription factor [Hydrogenimonas urashimensis]|uniref:response regulator transcription factor n=1 Tax=Hydrogenimonas urashimensis TaxID=2740515 RepID=UPI0019163034|nr:response regulator [Hydrogenimonas urashimensis]